MNCKRPFYTTGKMTLSKWLCFQRSFKAKRINLVHRRIGPQYKHSQGFVCAPQPNYLRKLFYSIYFSRGENRHFHSGVQQVLRYIMILNGSTQLFSDSTCKFMRSLLSSILHTFGQFHKIQGGDLLRSVRHIKKKSNSISRKIVKVIAKNNRFRVT